ncbi:MAG: Asp-tRNA(Asn)/Glu-tRNA(Gln) amidotransferase subunit GatC [Bacteroidia bacterium]
MKVNEQLIGHLSHLARLQFDTQAGLEMVNDLNRILGFVEKLEEVDTSGVEPLIYMTGETNILREDEVMQSITQDEALKNAPKKDSVFFRVPRFIDQE